MPLSRVSALSRRRRTGTGNHGAPADHRLVKRSILAALVCLTLGCQPDESPFRAEIATLKKQLAKQESVILSLQEGNKVMQQQIDLLNGELREAEEKTKAVQSDQAKLQSKIDQLTARNRKLSLQAKRALAKSAKASKAIEMDDEGAQRRELLYALPATTEATRETLASNGYHVRVQVKTDTGAVFVTDRKISAPTTLEVSGFKNQYVVGLHALPSKGTLLSVKADFEKTGLAGRVLPASTAEKAEIEKRLIAEILSKLSNSAKKKR